MINRLFYASDPSDKFNLLLKINIILLLAVSIFLRVAALDHIPGMYGDEAWYGVQMKQLYYDGSCAWRTPNGNPLNPFFSGIIFILQLFFPPHILVLRAPAVLSGLLFILLIYIFTRKMTDPITATLAAMLTAAFPTNIAYSRLGWDASQIGLVSCLVIYFAWRRNWLALTACILAAFLIHPTTIFLLPIIIVPIITDVITNRGTLEKLLNNKLSVVLFGGAILIFGIFVILPLADQVFYGSVVLKRLVSPSKWHEFFILFGRLFSGMTVSKFLAGYNSSDVIFVHDLLFIILFPAMIILGGRRLVLYRRWKEFAFLSGFILSIIALFLIGGKYAVIPGQERFSVYLMAPGGFVFAIALRSLARTPGQKCALILITGLMGWLLVFSFYNTYFQTIRKTGGLSAVSLRTAKIKPKKQALNIILSNAGDKTSLLILAEDFWICQPIRYLTSDNKNIKTIDLMGVGYPLAKFAKDMQEGAYAVGFNKGEIIRVLRYIPWSDSYMRWTIKDYGGRDLIYVWHRDDSSRNQNMR